MLERLKLALTRIESYQWREFEQFASGFLAAEFPTLRTVASESGDDGVDALLLSADSAHVSFSAPFGSAGRTRYSKPPNVCARPILRPTY
jgi:hypothetical protein